MSTLQPDDEAATASPEPEGSGLSHDELLAKLYRKLLEFAKRLMAAERPGQTLQATGLVHEAWLSLVDSPQCPDEPSFLGLMATKMRHTLVEHARARKRKKRGGDLSRVSVTIAMQKVGSNEQHIDVLALDEALKRLHAVLPRKAKVLEMRCFTPMGMEQIATAVGVSVATANRDLLAAKSWLLQELEGPPEDSEP